MFLKYWRGNSSHSDLCEGSVKRGCSSEFSHIIRKLPEVSSRARNFFWITRIFKSWAEAEGLPLYSRKRYSVPRSGKMLKPLPKLETKHPPGEISEDAETTAELHIACCLYVYYLTYRGNILYSGAQTPLVSPPPGCIDAASGSPGLEISRSVLHCSLLEGFPCPSDRALTSLGPYFKLHQWGLQVWQRRSTALQRRHAKTEYRNHNDV